MNLFTYSHAKDAATATAAVTRDAHAAFFGGGTTLVDLMQLEVMNPKSLVDVTSLPLSRIENGPHGGLRVGALVRNSELASDERIRRRYPVLSEAILSGASPQIRNMATTAGNLLQRTRCPYFRDLFSACNKREPGSGCAAQAGFTRVHAVLGTSEKCIATFPGDMPVALMALDAAVRTQKSTGNVRSIPLADFYVGYGEDPARETVLEHGELITAVDLPPTGWMARSSYVKVRDRASYEFALASAAVALDISGGTVREARVALGGIATKPWRSLEAEKALAGARAGEPAWRAAADAALADAKPQKDNAFKIELARRVLVRALTTAASREIA